MKKLLSYTLVAVVALLVGMLLADTKVANVARSAVNTAKSSAIEVVANAADVDTRMMVLAENPQLISRISEGGSFGGEQSMAAAQNMFGRTEDAIEDIRNKTQVIEVGPRSYLIRMPIVNAAFFETDEGIVLDDTGMGPAGPAIMDAIRSVSDKPIHTIIYTDISRDGMMTGPNYEAQIEMLNNLEIDVVASGGVASLEDISKLKEIRAEHPNLNGVISGKAIYDGELDVSEAIKLIQS